MVRTNALTSFLLASAAVALLALAAGCGDDDEDVNGGTATPSQSDATPHIRGEITDITRNPEGVTGSMLIEGTVDVDTEYDSASVRIDEESAIYRSVDGEREDATFADLEVGQTAEAWFEGPIAESYPVQAYGAQIVILE